MKLAREPVSSRPKPCASLKNTHESCPFAAPSGPRRKKNDRGQRSAFPSETPRFALSILAHRGQPSPGSSTIELPSAFAESGAYPPDREPPGSPRQCSLPLACRQPPEGHQIGARKRRTPENTILSQPYPPSQPTGRIAKAASWLHLSRVSPVLHPPERPSHTHTPKPGFGGRGHESIKDRYIYYSIAEARIFVLQTIRKHHSEFTYPTDLSEEGHAYKQRISQIRDV